jgi:hypothetical protein
MTDQPCGGLGRLHRVFCKSRSESDEFGPSAMSEELGYVVSSVRAPIYNSELYIIASFQIYRLSASSSAAAIDRSKSLRNCHVCSGIKGSGKPLRGYDK